jgi:hypothetical protein
MYLAAKFENKLEQVIVILTLDNSVVLGFRLEISRWVITLIFSRF